MKAKLSESQEDYLKHIYILCENTDAVSTIALADHLEIKPSSVTNMLKKLSEMNLVDYTPYKGVSLTDSGRLVALEVLRHHRLIELYLTEMLGYGWEEVHEEAERLEHVISERFEERIAEKLGNPTHDPHGDPIPTVDLELPEGPVMYPLNRVEAGVSGNIKRVTSQDKDVLNMLTRLGLTINSPVKLIAQERSGARIQTESDQFLIPIDLASIIWISPSNKEK